MFRVLAFALTGCAQTIQLDKERPERTIIEACADTEHTRITLDVSFPEREPGCGWGTGGNLAPRQGYITARTEDVASIDLPAGVAFCDVAFDFTAGDPPSEQQFVRYDDSFLLTLDGVVLAASHSAMIAMLPQIGHLRLYDWGRVAGAPLGFMDRGAYCLGEVEGLSTCSIPPTETPGVFALELGADIVNELAEHAWVEPQFTFSFVTIGDNDTGEDCAHAAVDFAVDLAYVPYWAGAPG